MYVAESLVRTGNPALDAYRQVILPHDYRIKQVNDHLYSVYPIGTPLMAAPFVYAIDRLPGLEMLGGESLSAYLLTHPPDSMVFFIEKLIASILTAINCVIIFGRGRYSLNVVKSIVLTTIFALGTSAWSTLAEQGEQGLEVLGMMVVIGALQNQYERLAIHPVESFRVEQVVFGDGLTEFQEALEAGLPALMDGGPGIITIEPEKPGIQLIGVIHKIRVQFE